MYACRCGNVGKLTRICATVCEPSFAAAHPPKNPAAPFLVLGGFADFILPSTYMNAHGAIIGLGNVAPVSLLLPSHLFTGESSALLFHFVSLQA